MSVEAVPEQQKKHRELAEIQQEYTNVCAKAGNLQYQIKALADDLVLINSTLRDLNLEAAASNAAQPKKVEETK